MSGECKHCEGEVHWKDNRGWFRDVCEECAQRVADERTPARELENPPHEVSDE